MGFSVQCVSVSVDSNELHLFRLYQQKGENVEEVNVPWHAGKLWWRLLPFAIHTYCCCVSSISLPRTYEYNHYRSACIRAYCTVYFWGVLNIDNKLETAYKYKLHDNNLLLDILHWKFHWSRFFIVFSNILLYSMEQKKWSRRPNQTIRKIIKLAVVQKLPIIVFTDSCEASFSIVARAPTPQNRWHPKSNHLSIFHSSTDKYPFTCMHSRFAACRNFV